MPTLLREIYVIPSFYRSEEPMATSRDFILITTTLMLVIVCANTHLIDNYQKSRERIHVDIAALQVFKSSVTHDPSQALANWDVANHVCNWTGVTCHPKKLRVSGLNLYNMSIQGTIPPHLGNVSFLGVLNLAYNSFSGTIPKELGKLRRLKGLLLTKNKLISSIPEALKDCTALRLLYLPFNNLNGSIPSGLGQLQNLRNLSLHGNGLTGKVPKSLGNCSALEVLSLGDNSLSGTIPSQFGLLTRIKTLALGANQLSGGIPPSLLNCTQLRLLFLYDNRISGEIPSEMAAKLSNLENLSVFSNRLTGKVPESLGNCSALETLDLGNNLLSGTVPSQLGLLVRMQYMSLGENQFSGGIPPSLLNCTELRTLGLHFNRLTGEIPSEMGTKLSNLEVLLLWGNELNGTIPKSLGNCSQLLNLELASNFLTGGIPQEFGKLRLLQTLQLRDNHLVNAETIPIFETLSNCTNLRTLDLGKNDLKGDLPGSTSRLSQNLSYLDLGENHFTGKIPQEMSNLTRLFLLDLHDNLLSGEVPSALGGLSTLQKLQLSGNKLEGNIPYQFSQLKALYELDLSRNGFSGEIVFSSLQQLRRLNLSYNKFSGNIPDSIWDCSNLELLDLSYNQLRGLMPSKVASLHTLQLYINVSHNALAGRIPAGLAGMQMVLAIDLSANNFSGSIPVQLVNCAGLEYLNLSYNSLDGTIPTSIGQLAGLQDMDFSFNKLSGTLPPSIEKLGNLSHLNVSYNNLTGEIPCSGAFRKLNFTSFLGNAGLCGRWIELPPCKFHHDSKRRVVIIVTSVGLTLLLVSFLVLMLLIYFRSVKSTWLESISARLGTMLKSQLRETKIVSEEEINRATNGFSPDNLVGHGGHGSVYKGVLDNGSIVAVKVIHSATSGGAYKRLIKECKTLGRVQHRNLVRMVGVCSSLQVKSLIMEFMSQGSLDMHLHGSENNCRLGLKRRLSILKDVAHGMAYLHHHCSPAIVHCDLKPSNVLLDEMMTAHVGDFGISRLMISPQACDNSTAAASGDTSSLLVGSIGYIAPEYGIGGRPSMKGDVYSYGILLLETITGKKPTDPVFSEEGQSGSTLQSWVGNAFPDRLFEVIDDNLVEEIRKEEDRMLEVIDRNLGEEIRKEEDDEEEESQDVSEIKGHGIAVWLTNIGMLCTKRDPHERPTLREVEASLEHLVAKIDKSSENGLNRFEKVTDQSSSESD
eukprot:PITA_07379